MFLLYCEILFTFFELDFYFLGLYIFFSYLIFLLKSYFILNKMKYNFISSLLSLLFFSIFFSNYLSMIPFSFVYSSQVYFCLFMSFSFFFSLSFFPKVYNMKSFFTHLCPDGIPFMLAPMLIIIEIISFFMRPIALFLRLFANITASHVLLSIFVSMVPLYMSFIIFPLFLLEIMVCSIQAYIFSLLLLLWFNE